MLRGGVALHPALSEGALHPHQKSWDLTKVFFIHTAPDFVFALDFGELINITDFSSFCLHLHYVSNQANDWLSPSHYSVDQDWNSQVSFQIGRCKYRAVVYY